MFDNITKAKHFLKLPVSCCGPQEIVCCTRNQNSSQSGHTRMQYTRSLSQSLYALLLNVPVSILVSHCMYETQRSGLQAHLDLQ